MQENKERTILAEYWYGSEAYYKFMMHHRLACELLLLRLRRNKLWSKSRENILSIILEK